LVFVILIGVDVSVIGEDHASVSVRVLRQGTQHIAEFKAGLVPRLEVVDYNSLLIFDNCISASVKHLRLSFLIV